MSTNASSVRIDTSPERVVEGEKVTINIYVNAHVPINAIDLEVAYPEDQLAIDSINTGESVITMWAKDPYAENGHIYLRGGLLRRGFLGEHLVARIRAHAIASGVARIVASETTFIAGDGTGNAVTVSRTGSEQARVHIDAPGSLNSTVTIGIVADVDADGDVDIKDIQKFLSTWRSRDSSFDFNGDGKMTFRDFGILLARAFLN
jgi:hypothetical protein